MRLRILTLCLALLSGPAVAQQVSITIDDLPYIPRARTTPQEGMKIVHDVNAALKAHSITATGFAIGNQIVTETLPAMDAFARAGHTLGNHSWSHADYDTLTRWAFRREVRRTDRAIRPWLKGSPKYYRFPYLREGKTEKTKRAAENVLKNQGYVNVPVTIDNDEWKFNQDYIDALAMGDERGARRIANAYLAHMKERTAHFQALAKRVMGRDISHILLLHMNKINADHLDDLLAWYAAQGWTFITVDEALRDPFFAAPDIYTGPRGLSQIERVLGRAAP